MKHARNASFRRKIGKPSRGMAIPIRKTAKGIAAGVVPRAQAVPVSKGIVLSPFGVTRLA